MFDGFKGIEGIKRKKQSEFLMLAALAYICLQIALKAVQYFLARSFLKIAIANEGKAKASETPGHQCNDISMIQLNWSDAKLAQ